MDNTGFIPEGNHMNKQILQPSSFIRFISNPLFGLFWLGFAALSYFYFDKPLAFFMYQMSNPVTLRIAVVISFLGVTANYLIIATIVSFVAKKRWQNPMIAEKAAYIFYSVGLSGLVCFVIKILLGRARPYEWGFNHLYGFYFFKLSPHMWSFPSGHATTIASAMIAASILWPRIEKIALLIMLLVAVSRLVIDAHYLSDVMCGLYLGCMTAILLSKYYNTNGVTQRIENLDSAPKAIS